MRWLYNLLLVVLSPVLLIVAVQRDLRRSGAGILPQRLGWLPVPPRQDRLRVWVHAASVGETAAAAPILRELQHLCPELEIVFSNITATGHETAKRQFPGAHTVYFPYDIPACVRRSLHRVAPVLCVLVETEIWPNFVQVCRDRGIPVVMVNGTLRDRSFRRIRKPFVRPFFRWMLHNVAELLMQSEADARRVLELGAEAARVKVIGNAKFDGALAADPTPQEVAAEMGWPLDRPTLVAGSTHAGEDELVLDAFLQARETVPEARLILAPRRLERVPELRTAIEQRGLTARYRSVERQEATAALSAPTPSTDDVPVLVLDTLGELRRVYALAQVAFVGGTLVPVGGHDLLQPLAKGKPVLFGPYTGNCRDIAAAILAADAGARVADGNALAPVLAELLGSPDRAAAAGERGRQLIEGNQGVSRRYAERLAQLLRERTG